MARNGPKGLSYNYYFLIKKKKSYLYMHATVIVSAVNAKYLLTLVNDILVMATGKLMTIYCVPNILIIIIIIKTKNMKCGEVRRLRVWRRSGKSSEI